MHLSVLSDHEQEDVIDPAAAEVYGLGGLWSVLLGRRRAAGAEAPETLLA